MSDPERYQDPILARRVRAWVKDDAPTAAPERLVYAVMDEVEREPMGRRIKLGPIRFETLWHYVALTVVIAIGVAAGTLATRQQPAASSGPSLGPTTSPLGPSASPVAAWPSLPTTERHLITGHPGPSAIGISGSSLWVGTPDGSIVELDASTGDELRRVAGGDEPIAITPFDGLLWVGSGGEDLFWVDPVSGDVGAIAGAGGHYVLVGEGSLWVSRREEFLRIDPTTRTRVGTVAVAGHMASDAGAIVGDELWADSGTEIVRIALPSGAVQGTIPGPSQVLIPTAAGVLAIDRGVLLRVSSVDGPLESPISILDGLPDPVGVALVGGHLWVTGAVASGGSEVVEINLASGLIASRTPVNGGARAIAVLGDSVWVAVETGELLRLRAGP